MIGRRWLPSALAVIALAVPLPVGAQGEAEATRLLAEAESRAEQGDAAEALAAYEEVARQWPETDAGTEALLRAAHLHFEAGDVTAATAAADRVVEAAPRSPRAASAQLLLGEIGRAGASGTEAGEQALESLHRVWALFPESAYPKLEARAEARVREGELEVALGRPARAQAAYLDVIEREPASSWRVRARRLLAEGFLDGGDWPAAVEALQASVDDAAGLESVAARVEGETARRRLAAIDRLILRPLAGQAPWSRAANLAGVPVAKPQGLAVSDEGLVAVADEGADVALVQQPDGSVLRMNLRGMQKPVWSAGRAWVPADGTLLTSGRAPQSLRGAPDAPKILLAATPVPFGWALATAKPDLALLASGELRLQATLALPERSEPVDIASDGRGRVMVLDGKSDRILVFDAPGAPARPLLAGKLDRPQGLAVGPLGFLYVLERGGRVTVADRSGSVIATVGPVLPGGPTLAEPRDLAVDGEGRLFLSDPKLGAIVVLE